MIEKAAAPKRWICPISPIKAGQPMATTVIGRRRPDRLDDDQAVGVDDVDDEECLPGKPSREGFAKNEATPVTEGFRTRFGLRPLMLAVPRPGLQALLAGGRSPRR
jgi:hypothetical protein